MAEGTGVPAGWYQDPVDAAVMRWWDGSSWTGHTYPPPAPVGVAQTVLPGGTATAVGRAVQVPASTAYQGGHVVAAGHRGGADPQDAALRWILPVGRTGLSVAAGYLGLVALVFFFLAPASLVVGLLALRGLRGSSLGGRGRAWFAVVVGALGTAGLLALLVAHLLG